MYIEIYKGLAIYLWQTQDEFYGYWTAKAGVQYGPYSTVQACRAAIDDLLEPDPDVKITSLSYPAKAKSGEKIAITWYVKNEGGDGTLKWFKIVDRDTGGLVPPGLMRFSLGPGGIAGATQYPTMPNRNWRMRAETGYDSTRTDSRSFTITLEIPAPYVKSVTISAPSSRVEGSAFTISGYVKDQFGAGMGGITVYLYRNGSYIGSDGTSSSGYYSKSYSISNAGVYTLKAVADSKSASRTITITKPPSYVNSVTISAPSSRVEDSAFTISGTVKDQYGARMGGVSVHLYQNGSHFATVTTNSSGNYSRSRTIYSPGTYELAAKADTKWAYRNITITEKRVTVGTTITLNISKTTVTPNEIFTWSGKLSRNDGGTPKSQTIRLRLNGTTVDSTTCDVNGNFSATETAPSSDGYYSYRSYFGGATLALERLEASMSPEKILRGA